MHEYNEMGHVRKIHSQCVFGFTTGVVEEHVLEITTFWGEGCFVSKNLDISWQKKKI